MDRGSVIFALIVAIGLGVLSVQLALFHWTAEHTLRERWQRETHQLRERVDELKRDLGAEMHIIFSTDCRPYQQWQTWTLVWSAQQVGQFRNSHLTQIVSGCDGNEALMAPLRRTEFGNFHVHFAGTYSPRMGLDGKMDDYPPYNRPFSIRHWLQHSERPILEPVIVILDPDQIFLTAQRINTGRFDPKTMLHWDWNTGLTPENLSDEVKEGVSAVSQMYGLGAGFLRYNLTDVCGPNSPCRVTSQVAHRHYSVGPPWILHRNDLARIIDAWADFLPRVRKYDDGLLAEQYCHSVAMAHHGLKYTVFAHYMVSAVEGLGEGWDFIDKNPCEGQSGSDFSRDPFPPPTYLHHCQGYEVDKFNYHKRHVPIDLLNCDSSLLKHPPSTLWSPTRSRHDKRSAWMICNLIPRINSAILDYKRRFCPPGYNTERNIVMHAPISCAHPKPHCWEFASWEHANGTRTPYKLRPAYSPPAQKAP